MSSADIPAANGLRRGTATFVKGRQRADEILRVAREVLAKEGYPHFTMRKIAARADISLGNLQYYFPSKNALLREVIEYNERIYDDDYETLSSKTDSPERRFYALVDYLLDDLEKPLVRGFLFQAWALTSHDDYVQKYMERAFAHYRAVVAKVIGELKPRLSKAECDKRASAIQSIIEGSQLSRVKKGKRFVQQPGLRELIRDEAYRLACR